MTVTVTDQHIARGRRGSTDCCPIALALNDATEVNGVRWRVTMSCLEAYRAGLYVGCAPLPDAAVDFARTFDYHGIASPLSFDIQDHVTRLCGC